MLDTHGIRRRVMKENRPIRMHATTQSIRPYYYNHNSLAYECLKSYEKYNNTVQVIVLNKKICKNGVRDQVSRSAFSLSSLFVCSGVSEALTPTPPDALKIEYPVMVSNARLHCVRKRIRERLMASELDTPPCATSCKWCCKREQRMLCSGTCTLRSYFASARSYVPSEGDLQKEETSNICLNFSD